MKKKIVFGKIIRKNNSENLSFGKKVSGKYVFGILVVGKNCFGKMSYNPRSSIFYYSLT